MNKQPNILMIVSDQHAPGRLGCYGSDEVQTPNLDELARDGVVFRDAYCNSPLCVPSRLSFLTGRYPWRIGAWNLLSPPPTDQLSLQQCLSQNGYHTVALGKMHFVGDEQMWGFDERPYGDFLGGSHQPDPIQLAPALTFQPAGPAEISEQDMQETIVTNLARQFITDYDRDDPFCLVVSYNKPHFPLRPPERFWNQYPPDAVDLPDTGPNFPERLHPWIQRHREFHGVTDWDEKDTRRALAGYYGCISFVDEKIGEVIHALNQSGLRENTVIIYVSDHGEMCGEHGLWGKSCFYDASVRVPLIISAPWLFSSNQQVDDIVELVDIYPTIQALAGIDTHDKIDGESLLPLMTDAAGVRQKQHAISELYGHSAVGPMRMLRHGDYKYIQYLDAAPSLFNLREDPEEFHDLAGTPAAKAIIDEFDAILHNDWDEQLVRQNFQFSSDRMKIASPRKRFPPNQYRLSDGSYQHAERFYPDVYPGVHDDS